MSKTDTQGPTLAQVVESAYGWANGDVRPGELVPQDEVGTMERYDAGGDGLSVFLWRELVADFAVDEKNTPAHWAIARQRCGQALLEVQAIYEALYKYGPEEYV